MKRVDGATIAEALVKTLDWRKEGRKRRDPEPDVDVVKVAEMFTELERQRNYYRTTAATRSLMGRTLTDTPSRG